MDRLIINCDLGENEPTETTRALIEQVDAVNIGCGFHAGSAEKTRETLEIARDHSVMIGAHPGLTGEQGRGTYFPSSTEFASLLANQFGRFIESASAVEATVDYVKLHGTLYHAVEIDTELRDIYVEFLRAHPKLSVFCLSGGKLAKLARDAGIRVYEEGFLDRGYLPDGRLVPRTEHNAVLDRASAIERHQAWVQSGQMIASNGEMFAFSADTWCVHGDSPDATEIIRSIRSVTQSG